MELVVSATGGLSESWRKYSMFVQTGRLTSASKHHQVNTIRTHSNSTAAPTYVIDQYRVLAHVGGSSLLY